MSVRIIYEDVAPGAAEDAVVTSQDADSRSDLSLIPFGSGNDKLYVTLEHNLWLLDSSYHTYDDGPIAFRSAEISDEYGEFLGDPAITIEFSAPYTSLGLTINFAGDCFCPYLNVKWYHSGTMLENRDFYNNGFSTYCETTVEAYDKVVLTFYGTSVPYRRLHVDEVVFGSLRVFERDELRTGSVKVTQEIDHTGRTLPANTLDWVLSSKQDVGFIFQPKQPVRAYDGSTFIGEFYIEGSDRLANRMYDITCIDAIGMMDNDPYPDVYLNNASAATLLADICGTIPAYMDADLQALTVSGILKGETRRSALQQLCFALRAVADTSGYDGVVVYRLATDEPEEVAENRIRTGARVRIAPPVTEVRVTSHSYSTTGPGESVVIGGVTYYDTQTVETILNPDVTGNEQPNVIEVTDCTLVSPDIVADVAQHLFDQVIRRRTLNMKFRLEGETMGDYLEAVTPWGDDFDGTYVRASIVLSGFALADAEVVSE